MFFSIALPTYEMNSYGSIFLDFSLEKISMQTFKDFNIIISDHSENNDIKYVCEKWSSLLNIKYLKKDYNKKSPSDNINNAIRNSDGEYIKILFQDDFLFDNNSLEIIKNNIINNPDSNWFVNSTQHSKTGRILYKKHIPVWSDNIITGDNTIGSPTILTIKNDKNKIYFDNDLVWLMDCDYYYRCYNKFGPPVIIKEVATVIRIWEHQLSNTLTELERAKDFLMIRNK